MQDKETKKRFENFVTEECGDSLWGNDGTDNYDTAYDVKDKVWDFISKLEQEAERRGYERGIDVFTKEVDEWGYLPEEEDMEDIVARLKLLEEENGKQNAR